MCSSGPPASQTTTQKSEPWAGIQPFLTGPNGIYNIAADQYRNSGWTQDMQNTVDARGNFLTGVQNSGIYAGQASLGNDLASGKYNFTPTEIQQINGAPQVSAGPDVQAQMIGQGPSIMAGSAGAANADIMAAFRGLGAADPTAALTQMLSGKVNTQYLDPVIANSTRRMTENLQETVLPSIGNDAFAAGQYGGTRQQIAEGIASRGYGYAVGDMMANMYNEAFKRAQDQQTTAATNLSNNASNAAIANANNSTSASVANAQMATNASIANAQNWANIQGMNATNALNAATGNANRGLSASQSNATNSLTASGLNADIQRNNNTIGLAASGQNVQNTMAGVGLVNQAIAGQSGLYGAQLQNQMVPADYNWNNATRYASIIQPGAGIGGTSMTTGPGAQSSPLMGAAGGAMMGAAIQGMNPAWAALGPWGMGIGAVAGLLLS